VAQNDFFCIGRTAKNPALAHEFVNFFVDGQNAYNNFVNFTGYTRRRRTSTRRRS
jgi:spermidine/putrescine-binding protein